VALRLSQLQLRALAPAPRVPAAWPACVFEDDTGHPPGVAAPDGVSAEKLFRRGARTLFQDLDRHFEYLPLLVQQRYLQFDPCDRGD